MNPEAKPPIDHARRKRERLAAAVQAPVVVVMVHRVRAGREQEFADLMMLAYEPIVSQQLRRVGGTWELLRNRTEPGAFIETMRFPSDEAREQFDDSYIVDRKVAAVLALLDEILHSNRAGYDLFEPVPAIATEPSGR